MVKHFQFLVRARLLDQPEGLELGSITLTDPAYFEGKADMTEADAAGAVLAELRYIKTSDVYQWRGAIIPKANFGGLSTALVSSWIETE
ncbi:hypothetical protein [Meiothermus taiwanensis]|uniref:hypothetical protein n=1 Tax=Meiothermus taiwanensis TaxID=172827 RepID=UPI0007B4C7A2|nr:hypothetical protein [Meiothermus taiwanensis]KZK16709.1 hypothetical protein A3962_14370 [Meiothermus taiwanensis]